MYPNNSNPIEDVEDQPGPGRWHYRVKVWLQENQLLRTVYVRADDITQVNDACQICFGREAVILKITRMGEDIVSASVRFKREYPQYLS